MSDQPPPSQDPSPSPSPKQLRRSTDDKVIAGVCGGVARYFGLDPVLVRIGFLVAALGFGTGFLLYLVCIFVMPRDDR